MLTKEASTALKWGNEPLPYTPGQAPESWKFLELRHPVTLKFGGHYHLVGSYQGHYYGPDQVAMCPTLEEEKSRTPVGEIWTPSHQIPGRAGVCTCGIHAQTLKNIRDTQDFKLNTLAQMQMPGLVRASKSGYRSSHASVLKLYTSLPMNDTQLQKAQMDLRIPIEKIDQKYMSNYGVADWEKIIDDHPELQAAMQRDIANVKTNNSRIAGPCPKCNNADTDLVDSYQNLRDGFCPQCGEQWTQESARERRNQANG